MADSASSSSDEEFIFRVYQYIVNRRRKRKSRRWWTRPWLQRRLQHGAYHALMQELQGEDGQSFHNFLRMDVAHFEELLLMVAPKLQRQDTNMRQSIEPAERLAVTLRFLASGDSYQSLHFLYRIGRSTLGQIIPTTCQAIVSALKDKYLKVPQTAEEWETIASTFHHKWNFPHCIGAIDGKHIAIKTPPNSGSLYYNYKEFHSILLLAAVDGHYRFSWYQLGDNGRQKDAGVFAASEFATAVANNTLNLPPPSKIRENGSVEVPYMLIGDDAFPLKPYLMKPYPQRGASDKQIVFNYRLSRARRVAENAFGILVNRFRVLSHTMHLEPHNATIVTESCLALHNFLRTERDTYYTMENVNGNTSMQWPLPQPVFFSGNNSAERARVVRNELQDYFWKEGEVYYQWEHIEGGRPSF